MSKPTITFHNTATGEIETREMNTAELAEHAALAKRYENYAAQAQAKAAAKAAQKTETKAQATVKAAILTQLGITEEQAKLLLS